MAAALAGKAPGPPAAGTSPASTVSSPSEGEKDAGKNAAASQGAGSDHKEASLKNAAPPAFNPDIVRQRDLFETLQARKRELDARQRAVEKEEEHLAYLRASLEGKIQELRQLQTKVDELLGQTEAKGAKELKGLIQAYGAMKADQAAKILSDMDESMALRILSGMEAAAKAKLLAAMDPQRAAELSQRLVTPASK